MWVVLTVCGIPENTTMPKIPHLLIPYAACTAPQCQQLLQRLNLPHLDWLLAHLSLQHHDPVSEESISPPHEQALARAVGLPLPGNDGNIPWAAWYAYQQGLNTSTTPSATGWAFIAPCHWQVGTEQIILHDPANLHLTEADSRALLEILAPWFEGDGIMLTYDQPTRWLAQGGPLAHLSMPSLERVAGRDVRHWVQRPSRILQRLQSELQMLLYTHPFNDAREARGQIPINAFWLHGAGLLSDAPPPQGGPLPQAHVEVLDALHTPAQQENWDAWASAWAALDAGPLAQLQTHVEGGGMVYLTLSGEQSAMTWHTAPRNLWQKILSVFRPKPFIHLHEQL